MVPLVREKLPEISALCEKFRVRKLEIFGSASAGDFRPSSDVDFLVEFEPMTALDHYHIFFELLDALKELLQRDVDLVEEKLLNNPYRIANIRAQRETIFERAHQSTAH